MEKKWSWGFIRPRHFHKVGRFKKGDKDGLWVEWYFGGTIDKADVIRIEKYDLGEIIERQCLDKREVSQNFSLTNLI